MRTVELSAIEYAQSIDDNDYTIETESAFIAGVKFAQRWIPIKRYKDGLTTQEQDDYFLNNVPFLVKSEYGIELFDGLNIELENEEFTHWRPIELK